MRSACHRANYRSNIDQINVFRFPTACPSSECQRGEVMTCKIPIFSLLVSLASWLPYAAAA